MVGMAQRSWVSPRSPSGEQRRRGEQQLRCIVVKAAEVFQGRTVAQLVLVLRRQGGWLVSADGGERTQAAAGGYGTGQEQMLNSES